MMRLRFRLPVLAVVLVGVIPALAASTPCDLAAVRQRAFPIQERMYQGYLEAAVAAWAKQARDRACVLDRVYYANALYWNLLHQRSNDDLRPQDVDRFLAVLDAVIAESRRTQPRAVHDPARAFAYAWAYLLRAQWKGFSHNWLALVGDVKGGWRWLERAHQLAPDAPEVTYYLGSYNYVMDRQGMVYSLIGWLLGVHRGDRKRAWPLLDRAVQQPSPLEPEMHMVRGAFLQEEGRWLAALQEIRWLRNRYPHNPLYHFWEGLFYERVAIDYDRAFQVYAAIWARARTGSDPRYSDYVAVQALHRMGYAAYKRFRFHEAERYLMQVTRWQGARPPWVLPKTYLVLGDLYRDWGRLRDARSAYARVMQYPPVLDYRARAAQRLHEDYTTPAWRAWHRYTAARVDLAEGRIRAGCENFKNWLNKNREPLAALGWAECLYAQGRLGDAILVLKRLVRSSSRSMDARVQARATLLLAQIYELRERLPTALRFYQMASAMEHAPGEYVQRAAYQIHRLSVHGG